MAALHWTALPALALCLTSCVGQGPGLRHDAAELIEIAPDKTLANITKREWAGFWGPEGYVGYKVYGYTAALSGDGPVFVDPHFVDNPPSFHCVGTITLDRDHKRITVNLRRVVSKEGEPETTKPHPANGEYLIESVRKPGKDDAWF